MTPEPITEELARRAAGADATAFEPLVRRIQGRLSMWISLRLGPALRRRVSEEDVFQETLIETHRGLVGFRNQGRGSFLRWILGVAENRIRDLSKYHSRDKRDMGREVAAPATGALDRRSGSWTSPSSAAERRERVARVVQRIEALPAAMREVVILRAIEDRTFADVAARLGKPVATVHDLYAQGLTRLHDGQRS